jgi:formylglycine-generating enzyme required for sulfatase activity/Leucine-rich repeat (LRR) protein
MEQNANQWAAPSSGYAMRHIPGQIFLAGPRDKSAARRGKTIRKAYWIGVVPVSQALWSKVTGAEVGSGPAATMPITGVSWFAAIDFANRLSEMDGFVPAYRVRGRAVSQRKDGNGYRLPTEAEWECAARAGGTSDYAGSDDIDRVAWYRGNSDGRLQPSGQKQPNANGLHDMSGNAATWCWDETEDKDSVEFFPDDKGEITFEEDVPRMFRGGSYCDDADQVRIDARDSLGPSRSAPGIGIRLVRTGEPGGSSLGIGPGASSGVVSAKAAAPGNAQSHATPSNTESIVGVPVLNAAQRKQLAATRKIYGAKDLGSVRQGVDLLWSLADPALQEVLSSGVRIENGLPVAGAEIDTKIRSSHREYAAFWVASLAGMLNEVPRLALSRLGDLTDLAPIRGLSALVDLDLRDCRGISDLSPLTGLTSLTHLNLRNCRGISDLSPLAGLTFLTHLDFSNCHRITDLSPLAGLTALTSLDLRYSEGITDLSPLAGLTALTSLELTGCNGISDLSPLAGLTALTSLSLSSDRITDLTPLAGLTALTSLFLSSDRIADLTPLAGLTALTSLSLDGGEITDLTPLAGLTALTSLSLRSNRITDLTPLAGLTELTTLRFTNHSSADLTSLDGFAALTSLELRCAAVSDLTPLVSVVTVVDGDLDLADHAG